ncbi:TonB-dependent receptor [Oceanospirillaceae bacterium ASx5O]|nr:TonB-dependent receptor [Oceanospirillaceae bacterium ASx5O]
MPCYPAFKNTRRPLWLALGLIPAQAVLAHTTELDTVVVSSPAQGSVYDVAQPVTVLDKNAIDNNSGSSLGTLLDNTPGMANAAFGPGVGRPVIRGMSGSRVKILQNGSDSADLSAMSSDHSPMAEASSAEQVEVIYGPATLMYGGGAIGGVVNLIDRRIHEQPGQGLSGDVAVKGSSNDDGYSADALLDMSKGNWTLHLDGFQRDAGNYQSGNSADAPADNNSGRIANSDSEGKGGAVALSWANGVNGFIGGSISTLEYDYGVPNMDGEAYRVKPSQIRYDLKGAWRPDPAGTFGWLDEWRTELSFNDYEHDETDNNLIVGFFDQQSWELQSRLRHQPIGFWSGTLGIQVKQQELALCHNHQGCDGVPSYPQLNWDGTQGLNFTVDGDYEFAHDSPMPATETTQAGLFLVEQRDWQYGLLEFGARVDEVRISADPDPLRPAARRDISYYDDKTFHPTSFTAAGTWVLTDTQRLGLNLARVQRAPEVTELYWNGDHHATFSFQLDNPDLGMETAWTTDLNWLLEGERNRVRIAVFYYRFADYIYNDLKAVTDPFHGDDVYRHEQADARFYGAEFSWQHNLNAFWHLDINADLVDAALRNGNNLPRTPPATLLLALNYERYGWDARLESKFVQEQKETAANEDASEGHILLNASLSYEQPLANSELIWQLSVQNLTDEYAVNHVSYLKQAAPLPGRNLQAGVRWRF